MSDLTDFNDRYHRIKSASAVFQKGIYHLFLLKRVEPKELSGQILRLYQCIFQLCLSQLLLDFNYKLVPDRLPKRLTRLCKDPKQPTRNEIDPAAIVTHSVFEEGKWSGFKAGNKLHSSSKHSLTLIKRIVDTRHNLTYRPFMLSSHWDDCTLIDLLKIAPTVDETEQSYQEFIEAVTAIAVEENEEIDKGIDLSKPPSRQFFARTFLAEIFMVYEDIRDDRPTETLLLTYARMLNPGNTTLLDHLKEYRNLLVKLEKNKSIFWVPEEFHAGEL